MTGPPPGDETAPIRVRREPQGLRGTSTATSPRQRDGVKSQQPQPKESLWKTPAEGVDLQTEARPSEFRIDRLYVLASVQNFGLLE